jgi:bacterial/archaeal transporter family protein
MENNRWLLYAIVGAAAASLINIFAKLGTRHVDSDLETAVRSLFQVAFVCVFCTAIGSWRKIPQLDWTSLGLAAAAGIAGGLSWIFVFRAIALADVTRVAPIDKLSLPLGIVLAVALLGERPTKINWVGIAMIVLGTYLATGWRPAAARAMGDGGSGGGATAAADVKSAQLAGDDAVDRTGQTERPR